VTVESLLLTPRRHCEEPKATRQSIFPQQPSQDGLPRRFAALARTMPEMPLAPHLPARQISSYD
jgi:hypothetical protein